MATIDKISLTIGATLGAIVAGALLPEAALFLSAATFAVACIKKLQESEEATPVAPEATAATPA